jgi:hypothetical protein
MKTSNVLLLLGGLGVFSVLAYLILRKEKAASAAQPVPQTIYTSKGGGQGQGQDKSGFGWENLAGTALSKGVGILGGWLNSPKGPQYSPEGTGYDTTTEFDDFDNELDDVLRDFGI